MITIKELNSKPRIDVGNSSGINQVSGSRTVYVTKSTDRLLWSLDRNNVCIALNNDTNIINPSSGYRTESIMISVIYKFTSNKSMRDTLDIMKAYSGENQMLDNEPELVIKALEDTLMDARADRLTISLRYAVDIKGSEEGEIMYFRNADLILFLDKVNLQILHKDSATFVNSQNTESFEIKEAKLNTLLISIYTKDGRECFMKNDSGPVAIATNESDDEEHVIMEMLRKDNSLIEINRKRIPLKELNRRGIIFNHLSEAESELSLENKQHDADMQKKDMEISKLKLQIEEAKHSNELKSKENIGRKLDADKNKSELENNSSYTKMFMDQLERLAEQQEKLNEERLRQHADMTAMINKSDYNRAELDHYRNMNTNKQEASTFDTLLKYGGLILGGAFLWSKAN